MAVKIEIDGYIKRVKPHGTVFTDKDILTIFKNGYQFIDMGVFIVIANDPKITSRINKVASLFLRYPVYGEIVMVSGTELEDDSFKTSENSKYAPKECDDGVINLIQETLITYKAITEEDDDFTGQQGSLVNSMDPANKQLLVVDPEKLRSDPENDDDRKFKEMFFKTSFTKISKRNEDLKTIILYEEPTYVIKFAPGKIIETLNAMIDYYTQNEEFEKCSVIRDVIKDNKNIDKK